MQVGALRLRSKPALSVSNGTGCAEEFILNRSLHFAFGFSRDDWVFRLQFGVERTHPFGQTQAPNQH